MDRDEGIDAIQKALDAIKEAIESHQGTFKVIMPVSCQWLWFNKSNIQPKVLTDLDEEEMKKRLELLEEDELGSSEEDEAAEEEGLVAPKGLDQAADAEEANRGGKENKQDEEEDSD